MDVLLNWFLGIQQALGASTFDTFLVIALIGSYLQNKWLKEKYQLLNTGLATHGWIIKLKLGVTTIRRHRNGDIELVDAINEIEGD